MVAAGGPTRRLTVQGVHPVADQECAEALIHLHLLSHPRGDDNSTGSQRVQRDTNAWIPDQLGLLLPGKRDVCSPSSLRRDLTEVQQRFGPYYSVVCNLRHYALPTLLDAPSL